MTAAHLTAATGPARDAAARRFAALRPAQCPAHPHIAGSLGNELHRMAAAAVDEVERYAAGLPFAHPMSREELRYSA